MTQPPNNLADVLRKALKAPNAAEDFLPSRAPGARMFTLDEAMQLVENIALALDRTARLPIRTTLVREPDGSRTIRVFAATGNE